MIDPAQHGDSPATAIGGGDHAVKIEQLLLAGLDHYFRGRFERAVDVWTRVLFLDRNHARARAYIERARAAVAERAREGEAFLHAGVEACDRGDVTEARALLATAIERGGAHDEALAVLGRVERLDVTDSEHRGSDARRRAGARRARRGAMPVPETGRAWRVLPWLVLIALFAAASGALFLAGSWAQLEPVRLTDRPADRLAPLRAAPPLPAPSSPQLALRRAEGLVAEGRTAEALGVLMTVGLGDGSRGDIELLRAEIQRDILGRLPEAPAGAGAPD
jgi:cytochrome c-type biogenesis protein CcmH/NrfG